MRTDAALAAWYKRDPGLLERHHSLRAFELVMCDAGPLQGLPAADRHEISTTVRDLIMATDMRLHAAFTRRLAACAAERAGPDPDVRVEGREDGLGGGGATLGMRALLKCADLVNVCRPFDCAMEWAVRVTDELFAQGDLERARGLDVTPLCDRRAQTRAGLQRTFIDGVVAPLVSAAAGIYPGLRRHAERLGANRRRWEGVTDDRLLWEVAAFRRARMAGLGAS